MGQTNRSTDRGRTDGQNEEGNGLHEAVGPGRIDTHRFGEAVIRASNRLDGLQYPESRGAEHRGDGEATPSLHGR